MTKYLLIALGGAFGSVLRYAMQGWFQRLSAGGFPAGTLAVNLVGCLAIGFLSGWFPTVLVRPEYRIGLLVGLLGGFTTFSAFGLETFNLANEGQFRMAAANVTLSCGLGFAAVWIGYRMAERWFGV
ncbi:MAG: fluoride efflux transporter CrcB [Pirellulales bacterium]